MTQYSIEPKTRKFVKEYGFLSFARQYNKQVLDKGLDASRKEVHKAAEITDAVTKSKNDNVKKREPIEETIIREILRETLRKVL